MQIEWPAQLLASGCPTERTPHRLRFSGTPSNNPTGASAAAQLWWAEPVLGNIPCRCPSIFCQGCRSCKLLVGSCRAAPLTHSTRSAATHSRCPEFKSGARLGLGLTVCYRRRSSAQNRACRHHATTGRYFRAQRLRRLLHARSYRPGASKASIAFPESSLARAALETEPPGIAQLGDLRLTFRCFAG